MFSLTYIAAEFKLPYLTKAKSAADHIVKGRIAQWDINQLFLFRRNWHVVVFPNFFLVPIQLGPFFVYSRSFCC